MTDKQLSTLRELFVSGVVRFVAVPWLLDDTAVFQPNLENAHTVFLSTNIARRISAVGAL